MESLACGTVVRLTTPYRDAKRGIYTVIYLYSNGWYGVRSHGNGESYSVPAFVCRPVDARSSDTATAVGKRRLRKNDDANYAPDLGDESRG